jgi:hypothetical protein
VRVTPSPSPSPDEGAHPASATAARPALRPNATSLVLRLFIVEPLESFDSIVESDLDAMNIRHESIWGQQQQIRRGAETCAPTRP